MRTPPDPVLYCAMAFAAAVTVAGAIRSHLNAPPVDPRTAAALHAVSGVVGGPQLRFTEADVEPVVEAMHTAGFDTFVVRMDPTTGNTTVELGEDATPHLDIKPGSCPNTISIQPDGGRLAAAAARVTVGVLGNAFDVTQIDVDSTRMTLLDTALSPNVTRPVHMTFADVGTPFIGEGCACHALQGDGLLDFVAQFDKASMIRKLPLNTFPHNSQVPLRVYGMLNEGRGIFSSHDCVRIVTHGSED